MWAEEETLARAVWRNKWKMSDTTSRGGGGKSSHVIMTKAPYHSNYQVFSTWEGSDMLL